MKKIKLFVFTLMLIFIMGCASTVEIAEPANEKANIFKMEENSFRIVPSDQDDMHPETDPPRDFIKGDGFLLPIGECNKSKICVVGEMIHDKTKDIIQIIQSYDDNFSAYFIYTEEGYRWFDTSESDPAIFLEEWNWILKNDYTRDEMVKG